MSLLLSSSSSVCVLPLYLSLVYLSLLSLLKSHVNNMKSPKPPYTDSISLEHTGSPETTDPRIEWDHKKLVSETEFHKEINKLKAASTKKFKDKWEAILDKYAHIDDNLESDEIDLSTGNIIVDNGHLRSLRNHVFNGDGVKINSNVWAPDFDEERDASNARRRENHQKTRKHLLKQKLKAQDHFYVENIHRHPSPVRKVSPDNILLLDPSPTKKQKISPTKKKVMLPMDRGSPGIIDSESDEFDLPSQEEEEEEYEKRESSAGEGSEDDQGAEEAFASDQLDQEGFDISESEGEISDSQDDSVIQFPIKRDSTIESETAMESETAKESDGDDGGSNNHTESEESGPEHQNSSDSSDSDIAEISETSFSLLTSKKDFERHFTGTAHEYVSPFLEQKVKVDDFEEEFSIVLGNHSYISTDQPNIFCCCFKDCHYTTGNKTIFERHLLETHRTELYIIGYPIKPEEVDLSKNPTITRNMINSLTKDFPLVHEVPGLPLSGDGKMFGCKLQTNNHSCKREFLTVQELNHHQDNYPFRCSTKTQVYVCPLLGCGFMTDGGYFSYRDHFIREKHFMEQDPRGVVEETRDERDVTDTDTGEAETRETGEKPKETVHSSHLPFNNSPIETPETFESSYGRSTPNRDTTATQNPRTDAFGTSPKTTSSIPFTSTPTISSKINQELDELFNSDHEKDLVQDQKFSTPLNLM